MFQYENTVKGKINVEKTWSLYSDVSLWSKWDSDMQEVELDGDFTAGATGTMFMKEMPPLPFTLIEVQAGRAFVNESTLGATTVTFGHFISENVDGECTLKHTVSIKGEDEAQIQGMGQGIVVNIPASMERLFELVKVD